MIDLRHNDIDGDGSKIESVLLHASPIFARWAHIQIYQAYVLWNPEAFGGQPLEWFRLDANHYLRLFLLIPRQHGFPAAVAHFEKKNR